MNKYTKFLLLLVSAVTFGGCATHRIAQETVTEGPNGKVVERYERIEEGDGADTTISTGSFKWFNPNSYWPLEDRRDTLPPKPVAREKTTWRGFNGAGGSRVITTDRGIVNKVNPYTGKTERDIIDRTTDSFQPIPPNYNYNQYQYGRQPMELLQPVQQLPYGTSKCGHNYRCGCGTTPTPTHPGAVVKPVGPPEPYRR